jgi:hypothetical protein
MKEAARSNLDHRRPHSEGKKEGTERVQSDNRDKGQGAMGRRGFVALPSGEDWRRRLEPAGKTNRTTTEAAHRGTREGQQSERKTNGSPLAAASCNDVQAFSLSAS